MRHLLGIALIWGWFFAMQAEYDDEGVVIISKVKGFKTEQACKDEYSYVRDLIKKSGRTDVVFKKCAYEQES